jgi:hypothetical protein
MLLYTYNYTNIYINKGIKEKRKYMSGKQVVSTVSGFSFFIPFSFFDPILLFFKIDIGKRSHHAS